MKSIPTLIELTESTPLYCSESTISDEVGIILWNKYSNYIDIDKSFKTENNWELINKGWVGRICLDHNIELILKPKFDIDNIFRMLEYIYELDSNKFKVFNGSTKCDIIEDFYESLAIRLARYVLARGRKGFYKAYKPKNEKLPFVRGRLDIKKICVKPWDVKLDCHFEDHTFNIIENQIILWTLQRILHSGLCKNRSLPQVHRAYQSMQGLVAPVPCNHDDCIKRFYNRLNQDYEPIHALCRFFLEHSGPTYKVGEHIIQPFLIDMPYLYEAFVAKWIETHKSDLPSAFSIRAKKRAIVGKEKKVKFEIDIVIYKDGKAYCVLDTKYKTSEKIKKEDFNQVVAYASLMDCHNAFLVYPIAPDTLLDVPLPGGNIRVRSLTFSLSGDLDQSGHAFINELIGGLCQDK